MRTPEQIVTKCLADASFLGFGTEALIPFLTFEQAKPLLKPEAEADKWGDVRPLTRESVMNQMREYMEFAWGKVEDHRGISAGRSVEKMEAWLWLLEDEETLAALYVTGAPKLKFICDKYGFQVPDSRRLANMMASKPCCSGCDEGCGA